MIPTKRTGLAVHVARMFVIALVIAAVSAMTPALAKKKSAPKPPKIDKKTAKFETDIMKKLVDRQSRVITRALVLDTQSSHTELVAFAQLFIAQEQTEMATLQNWLKTWYNVTYTPKKYGVDHDLASETGTEFDLDYLDLLIGHENSEIAYCKQLTKKAKHPELKTFANDTITTNRAELSILKEWQRAWEPADEDEEDD